MGPAVGRCARGASGRLPRACCWPSRGGGAQARAVAGAPIHYPARGFPGAVERTTTCPAWSQTRKVCIKGAEKKKGGGGAETKRESRGEEGRALGNHTQAASPRPGHKAGPANPHTVRHGSSEPLCPRKPDQSEKARDERPKPRALCRTAQGCLRRAAPGGPSSARQAAAG